MSELRECPFCHGERGTPLLVELSIDEGGGFIVVCFGCAIKTATRSTRLEAAKIWNNRRPDPAPVGVRVPEKRYTSYGGMVGTTAADDIWNDCVDEILRLNPQPGAVVGDEVVAHFVEEAAKIISGAPFPSGRSMTKAREIRDLALRTLTNTDKGVV